MNVVALRSPPADGRMSTAVDHCMARLEIFDRLTAAERIGGRWNARQPWQPPTKATTSSICGNAMSGQPVA